MGEKPTGAPGEQTAGKPHRGLWRLFHRNRNRPQQTDGQLALDAIAVLGDAASGGDQGAQQVLSGLADAISQAETRELSETELKRREIIALLTGEKKPEVREDMQGYFMGLREPMLSLNFNEISFEVSGHRIQNREYEYRPHLRLTIPLGEQDITPATILVQLDEKGKQIPLQDVEDIDQLNGLADTLTLQANAKFYPGNAEELGRGLQVKSGKSQTDYVSNGGINASTAQRARTQEIVHQQLTRLTREHPGSPLIEYLGVLQETVAMPDRSFGIHQELKADVEQLVGTVGLDQQLHPGLLFTPEYRGILETVGSRGVQRYLEEVNGGKTPSENLTLLAMNEIYMHITEQLLGLTLERKYDTMDTFIGKGEVDYLSGRVTYKPGAVLTDAAFAKDVLGDLSKFPALRAYQQQTISQGRAHYIESAIEEVKRFLRSDEGAEAQAKLEQRILWFPNPDEFSLQWGVKPKTRTIDWDDFGPTRSMRGGTLHAGEQTEAGHIPLQVGADRIISAVHVEPLVGKNKIEDVYEVQTEEGKPKLDAEGHPIKKDKSTKLKKPLRPTFVIKISESDTAGQPVETYSVWRSEHPNNPDKQVILIQCSSADKPTMYEADMVTKFHMNVTRKPVIYLYPTKSTKVQVKLDYKGQLTNTYPKIAGDAWNVTAMPDGTLSVGGKKYKYLFWDGVNGEVDWDFSKGFCVKRDDVDSFLEKKIEALGLNFAEAQDFITYWAPMMKQNEWNLVSFQTEKYEDLAKLEIKPQPDTLIRVFMVFKKLDAPIEIPAQRLKKITRKGFTVVEWGGSNLDEVQQMASDRFVTSKKSPYLFV